ncbi:polysaccharide pyruvyl transferase family protein [Winogradskyella sp. DF17]|uniref:Polysaccharide pyruvyl transferase family protein n=1 Tax=Winogradskyella pelagia TaxID=2819984 RepID=A0ABS3T338_9FLAO|nr:polysaccharide pyruvyl transferase family protein [Winogradskyella sp. DF17]MBO3116694.1 polysaccharide pyruvyl transferase family protein [Winogradskyella sp. DF17]
MRSVSHGLKTIYRQGRHLYRLNKAKSLDVNAKPSILNLNIIDSCNSKCTMCNIWKQEEELEITPEELETVLCDPLFSELKYVGVTGGEPTLREDLPDIYSSIIKAVPGIKGLSIITNAIENEEVINRIKKIKNICDENGVHFSAMVSIDGVGKAHDQVRGVKGNFDKAIKVFNYLEQELKIPTSFGCTISKINAWDADDLLYYAKKYNMYGRFRIAETINRLYNQDRGKVIRNFNADETFNLLLFFEKLKLTYEKNGTFQRTYSSIQNILKGGDRLIGCPYHNDGIVLGSKGQISYCAPKSKIIGNALELSSLDIYKNNFEEKERILKEHCNSCIHDYHAPITYKERKIELEAIFNSKILNIKSVGRALKLAKVLKGGKTDSSLFTVFVLGWYGTETVGDKAILGGIVNYYKEEYNSKVEFVIGSLYPFVTERTCEELELKAKVVSTKTLDLLRYAKSSDEIVMGGGPLMDLEVLYVPYLGFKIAKAYGKKTTVFGCGIGPLKHEKYLITVKEIFSLTDYVKLRDKDSIAAYNAFGYKNEAELFGDPAKGFVLGQSEQIDVKNENVLSCFLRDWTFEYFPGEKSVFEQKKTTLEQGIAKLIKREAERLNVDRIELHHMHNFVVGNDDRDFSRRFIDTYFQGDVRVVMNKKLSTVDSIIEAMKKSKLNICMRFHSVLFAHTLKTDFIAIDYTMGGKIHAYLKDNEMLENLKTIESLTI